MDLQLAGFMPEAAQRTRAHYKSFRTGLEMYDVNAEEGVRRAWMDRLAAATEGVSRKRALKMAEEYRRFLGEDDRRAAVARRG